jgi:hypothetical protein
LTKKPFPSLTLTHWVSPIWGERWSLACDGRGVMTRGTEQEIVQHAKAMGWTIRKQETP